jgi:hypothetical protein
MRPALQGAACVHTLPCEASMQAFGRVEINSQECQTRTLPRSALTHRAGVSVCQFRPLPIWPPLCPPLTAAAGPARPGPACRVPILASGLLTLDGSRFTSSAAPFRPEPPCDARHPLRWVIPRARPEGLVSHFRRLPRANV